MVIVGKPTPGTSQRSKGTQTLMNSYPLLPVADMLRSVGSGPTTRNTERDSEVHTR